MGVEECVDISFFLQRPEHCEILLGWKVQAKNFQTAQLFSLHNSLSNVSDKKNIFGNVDLRYDTLMMSSVVNRSGVLAGEAFDVVDELLVDPEVVPNFLLTVS